MPDHKEEKIRVYRNPAKNEEYFKNRVGMGTSYDVGVRKLTILDKEIQLYYLNGLCDTAYIIHLMRELVAINNRKEDPDELVDIVENRLLNAQVEKVKTLDETTDQVLSGLVAVIVEGAGFAFIIDVRSYPAETRKNLIRKRWSGEPETDLLKISSSIRPFSEGGSETNAFESR